jgi:hypothetical protein
LTALVLLGNNDEIVQVFVFQAQTNSAKRRRRLCYHPEEEEIQTCVLLDHPASKTKKKNRFWVGKNLHFVSIKELQSFPDDILL